MGFQEIYLPRPGCMVGSPLQIPACSLLAGRYHQQATYLRPTDTDAEHKRLVTALMREDVTTASERKARLSAYS
jgi:hypothetical protein